MQEQEAGVTFSTVENHQDAKRCNALTSQRLGKLTTECNITHSALVCLPED